MGKIGPIEIIILLTILVIIFGAKLIPKLMRGIGAGVREFKKASSSEDLDLKKSTTRISESFPFKYFLEAALKGGDLIFQDSIFPKKRGANLEAMLFTSTYILKLVKQARPANYDYYQSGFVKLIYNHIQEQGLIHQLPEDFKHFFEQRFKIYSQDLDSIQNPNRFAMVPLMNTVHNLYDNPLTKNGSISMNLGASTELIQRLPVVLNFLNQSVALILKDF
jgi:sec-independent protein translocase protein TatA